MYAIAERRDSNKQPYSLSIAPFTLRRRDSACSIIIDKNGYLIDHNRYLDGNIEDLIYGNTWHGITVLSFPRCHVNRRQMSLNFWKS